MYSKKLQPHSKSELISMINDDIALSYIDTSLVTDMSELFCKSNRKSFKGIESWVTSQVTSMEAMFWGCEYFNEKIPFDTRNVEFMQYMFFGCERFNQPLDFNTSKVKSMQGMFCSAKSFNQELHFDTRNVRSTAYMFANCLSLNSKIDFDTQNTQEMQFMFWRCKSYKLPLNLSTKSAINTADMYDFLNEKNEEFFVQLFRENESQKINLA